MLTLASQTWAKGVARSGRALARTTRCDDNIIVIVIVSTVVECEKQPCTPGLAVWHEIEDDNVIVPRSCRVVLNNAMLM